MSWGDGQACRQESIDSFLSTSTASYNRSFSRGLSVVSEFESEYDELDLPDDWDEDFVDERFEPGPPKIPFRDIHRAPSAERKCFIPGQKVKVVSITAVDTGRVISPLIYTIKLAHSEHVWSIRRRYKHFQELHKELLIERAKFSIATRLPTEHGREQRRRGCPRRRLPRFPKTPDALVRDDKISRRCDQLRRYLQNALRCRLYRNDESMLKFLEVSHLSFVHNLGVKSKEGIIKKRSGGRRINIGPCSCCPQISTSHWSDRWLIVKDTFVAYVHPEDGRIGDVLLMDQDFRVLVGRKKTGIHHGLKISNLSRHLLIKSWTHRKAEEWQKCIEHTASTLGREFTTANRFDSFAPERVDTLAQWFVDGCSYFDSVATALELAKEEIFITDWWLSPELYLKRPMVQGNQWRLDHILHKKANEGVKVFILLYKEIEMALGINSYHSKQVLKHDNIKILRHPDHGAGGVLLWAHHEKIVCIDQRISFLGGLDLCYGRWDDQVHRLTDLGAVPVDGYPGEPVLSPIAKMTMQIMECVTMRHPDDANPTIVEDQDTIQKSTKEIESLLEMTKSVHLSIRDEQPSIIPYLADHSIDDHVFDSSTETSGEPHNNNYLLDDDENEHTVKIGKFEVTAVGEPVDNERCPSRNTENVFKYPTSNNSGEDLINSGNSDNGAITRCGSKKRHHSGEDLIVMRDSLKVPPLARFFSDEYGCDLSSESSDDEHGLLVTDKGQANDISRLVDNLCSSASGVTSGSNDNNGVDGLILSKKILVSNSYDEVDIGAIVHPDLEIKKHAIGKPEMYIPCDLDQEITKLSKNVDLSKSLEMDSNLLSGIVSHARGMDRIENIENDVMVQELNIVEKGEPMDDSGLFVESPDHSPYLEEESWVAVKKKMSILKHKQSSKDSGQGQSFEQEPLLPQLNLNVNSNQASTSNLPLLSSAENTPRKNVRFHLSNANDKNKSQNSTDVESDLEDSFSGSRNRLLVPQKSSSVDDGSSPPSRKKRSLKKQIRIDGSPAYPSAQHQRERIAEMKFAVQRIVSVDATVDIQPQASTLSKVLNDSVHKSVSPAELDIKMAPNFDEVDSIGAANFVSSCSMSVDGFDDIDSLKIGNEVTSTNNSVKGFDDVDSLQGSDLDHDCNSPTKEIPAIANLKAEAREIRRQTSSPTFDRVNKPPDLVLVSPEGNVESCKTWHMGDSSIEPTSICTKPSTPKESRKRNRFMEAFLPKYASEVKLEEDQLDETDYLDTNLLMPPTAPLIHNVKTELSVEKLGFEGDTRLWIGKDYVNFIAKDFVELNKPYKDFIDRTTTPRMPWHDIGCVLFGKAARDVSRHFIQRWNFTKMKKVKNNPMFPLLLPKSYSHTLPASLFRETAMIVDAQILRSASQWSAGIKNMEDSIHKAYIYSIENAKHYIYIENQFFISIPDSNEVSNGVAEALFNRILRAHQNGETFRVYVVMPLLPGFEGEIGTSKGAAIQAILHWSFLSLSRGGNSLLEKLQAAGVTDTTEYISFYGLRQYGELRGQLITELIYVHSKLMIVDDTTVIMGSANINDRSLLGKRDSEIAVYIKDVETRQSRMNGQPYRAGVYASSLRKTLFKEHLGIADTDNTVDLNDPAIESFYKVAWAQTAGRNTRTLEKVFKCIPCDTVHSFEQLRAWQQERPLAQTHIKESINLLQKVKGHLVNFPLNFLCKENLSPAAGTKEALVPTSLWT